MSELGRCEDCGKRRELTFAGVQRGNVCAECRASYHQETDEELEDRGAPPRKKNARRRVETVKGWAYRFYKRSDPNHHLGDVLSDVRMYERSARHKFADALEDAGKVSGLAYSAKVEEEKTELAKSGRGFREIVDDVDRFEDDDRSENPKHVYDFWDPKRKEYLGTVYSDEPISDSKARKKMIGRLLSHGETLPEAKRAVDACDVESFESASDWTMEAIQAARRPNPDNWREVGSSGDFPRWLRELKKRSGAYAIRDRKSGEVLYVGESHTDRLYQTLTRHFQHWDGPTAGTRYTRGNVEVAFEATPKDRAERKQLYWIESLNPRDNSYGRPETEEEIDSADFVDGVPEAAPAPEIVRTNPSRRGHRIPKRVAQLGTTLDLVIERKDERAIYRDEIHGALLLAPEDAMDRRPGGGRLFIVRGQLAGARPIEPDDAPRAQDTFEKWHRSHGADKIGSLDVPDEIAVPMGRAIRIGYRSDKFGGKSAAYEHDFEEPFPLVYATSKSNPKAIVIVGGGFTVSGRGIVG